MSKTKEDEAYERGVQAGLRGTFIDDFQQGISKGFGLSRMDRHLSDIYDKGYEWGQEHRPDGLVESKTITPTSSTSSTGEGRSSRASYSRSSSHSGSSSLDDKLIKWGASGGAIIGAFLGFMGAGIGGAIVGAVGGAIVVPLAALAVVYVLWPAIIILIVIAGLAAVLYLIGSLWGVGKP